MEIKSDHRPGEYLLNRFAPHVSGRDQELARERLEQWAAQLVKIARRMADKDMHAIDSRESGSGSKIQPIL